MIERAKDISDIHVACPPEHFAALSRMLLGYHAVNPEVTVTFGETIPSIAGTENFKPGSVFWIRTEDEAFVPVVTADGVRNFADGSERARSQRVALATIRGIQSQLLNPSAASIFEPFVVVDKKRLLGLRADRLPILAGVLRRGMPKLEGVAPPSAAKLIEMLGKHVFNVPEDE